LPAFLFECGQRLRVRKEQTGSRVDAAGLSARRNRWWSLPPLEISHRSIYVPEI